MYAGDCFNGGLKIVHFLKVISSLALLTDHLGRVCKNVNGYIFLIYKCVTHRNVSIPSVLFDLLVHSLAYEDCII